jgi:hypothetical protein
VTPMTQGQRDAAAMALSDRSDRSWPPDVARLELALQHVARTSTLDDARTVAAQALVLHNESAQDAVKGTGR